MPTHNRACLPDKFNWRFDCIESVNPDRALTLAMASAPSEMLVEITNAFKLSLDKGEVRFGYEIAHCQPNDFRIVIQFNVSTILFDQFLNSRTGYRAHFRGNYKFGLKFNREIIFGIRQQIISDTPDLIRCAVLNSEFKSIGHRNIRKISLIDSLDLTMSKIWFCTKLIKYDESIEELPLDLLGPRILLDNNETWAAPYCDDGSAWLEVKGAFLGQEGPHQPKDPIDRAKGIHETGTA